MTGCAAGNEGHGCTLTYGQRRETLCFMKAVCRENLLPSAALEGSERSAATELPNTYVSPGKTSSALLAEMQANALQRLRGKRSPQAYSLSMSGWTMCYWSCIDAHVLL